MLETYFGNMFDRTTSDPFRNYSGATRFTDNGYPDVDRRGSDRGARYISDLGDSSPGSLILKSTPILLAPAPGPDSKRTGITVEKKKCCPVVEEEEEEDEDCVQGAVDYLNNLPKPADFDTWLDTHGRFDTGYNWKTGLEWRVFFDTVLNLPDHILIADGTLEVV